MSQTVDFKNATHEILKMVGDAMQRLYPGFDLFMDREQKPQCLGDVYLALQEMEKEILLRRAQLKPSNGESGFATKQVIVMRTDTDPPMRKGKMISQGGHSVAAFTMTRLAKVLSGTNKPENFYVDGAFDPFAFLEITPAMWHWIQHDYPKICCRVDSEEDLLWVYRQAVGAGLEVHLITDKGRTEFKKPTLTCLAIGPDIAEKIDPITGHLKLL